MKGHKGVDSCLYYFVVGVRRRWCSPIEKVTTGSDGMKTTCQSENGRTYIINIIALLTHRSMHVHTEICTPTQTTWTQPISLPKKTLSNDQRTSHTDTARYTTSDALQFSGFLLQVLKVPCQHGNWKKREKKEDIKWTSFSVQVCTIQDSIFYKISVMDLIAVDFYKKLRIYWKTHKNQLNIQEMCHTEQIYYLGFCCLMAWTWSLPFMVVQTAMQQMTGFLTWQCVPRFEWCSWAAVHAVSSCPHDAGWSLAVKKMSTKLLHWTYKIKQDQTALTNLAPKSLTTSKDRMANHVHLFSGHSLEFLYDFLLVLQRRKRTQTEWRLEEQMHKWITEQSSQMHFKTKSLILFDR